MNLKSEKIFLGTAQFLSKYGVVNNNKNFSYKYFFKILEYAGKNSIFNYDTAPDYNSEEIIGQFILANKIKNAKVLTKIPKIKTSNYQTFVEKSISNSLKKLNSDIFTLFFHSTTDIKFFLKNPNFFINLKKKFPIKNIGFSIYEPGDLKEVIKHKIKVSIQFPYNVVNQSFLPLLDNKMLKPVFARSIFLQGILLKKITNKKINSELRNSVKNYINFLNINKISPLEFNLSFINHQKNIDYLIFGIEKEKQLRDILNADFSKFDYNNLHKVKKFFNKRLTDPRNW